jgi:hypothetical protein
VPSIVTPDDLTTLLERFRIERGTASTAGEAADAQLQILVARIAELTGVLRDAPADDTGRLAARLLLADLAQVAGQFRGRANETGASIASALDHLAEALRAIGPPPAPPA